LANPLILRGLADPLILRGLADPLILRELADPLILREMADLVLKGGNELLALDRFGLQLLEPRHLHHCVCFSVWLGVCDEGL